MGKNVSKKKVNYGDMAKQSIVPNQKQNEPTYTPAHATNKKAKERKTERLQLLVRPSTKSRLAQYAEDHNTSSNEVVQQLLDDLLDTSGY